MDSVPTNFLIDFIYGKRRIRNREFQNIYFIFEKIGKKIMKKFKA